ncbi:MAG: LamG-like jellyroll fold domain-containing protein, partial [Planctomycetota bacterium]
SSLNTLILSEKITTEPLGDILAAYDDSNDVTRMTCTPPVYNYDINGDLAVNFEDFVILASEWSNSGCEAADYYCYGADIDRDGQVDVTDAAIFSDYWLNNVPSQILAYYTFDNNDVYDSTGLKNDGYAINPVYDTNVPPAIGLGKSINFSESAIYPDSNTVQYLQIPNVGLPDQFSLTLWVKLPADFNNPGGAQTLFANRNAGAGIWVYVNTWNSNDKRIYVQTKDINANESSARTGNDALTYGEWHHVAIARNRNTVRIYVDGNDLTVFNYAQDDFYLDSPGYRLGANETGTMLPGWFDDVAVWNTAISSSTVSDLAKGIRSPADYMNPVAAPA